MLIEEVPARPTHTGLQPRRQALVHVACCGVVWCRHAHFDALACCTVIVLREAPLSLLTPQQTNTSLSGPSYGSVCDVVTEIEPQNIPGTRWVGRSSKWVTDLPELTDNERTRAQPRYWG